MNLYKIHTDLIWADTAQEAIDLYNGWYVEHAKAAMAWLIRLEPDPGRLGTAHFVERHAEIPPKSGTAT